MLLIFTNYNELATCSGCLDPTGAVSEACVNETHTGAARAASQLLLTDSANQQL